MFATATPGTVKVLASAFVKVTIHGHNFGATAAGILSMKISGHECFLLEHAETTLDCTITQIGMQNHVAAGTTSAANIVLSTTRGMANGPHLDPMSRLSGGYTGPMIVNATFEADSFQPCALAVDEPGQWVSSGAVSGNVGIHHGNWSTTRSLKAAEPVALSLMVKLSAAGISGSLMPTTVMVTIPMLGSRWSVQQASSTGLKTSVGLKTFPSSFARIFRYARSLDK